MRRHALTVLLVLCAAPLAAQPDPNYVFGMSSGSGAPGAIIELQALASNTGENIDGWSFGVCSDPAEVTVIYLEPGEVIENLNGGSGPFFYISEILPDGFTTAVIVN